MGRNHRRPGVIRITCTDDYHHDQPGYGDQGHHHVGTLRPVDGGYAWHPVGVYRPPAPPGGNDIDWSEVTGPVKGYRPDGSEVWVLYCTCGRTPERSVADVAAIAARQMLANPGRRPEIDLVDLG